MSKLTRTPTQTLPKCQQRSLFSSTLRTTHLSRKGAGPGDSAPSSFLVSFWEALAAELGRGECAFCVLCGERLQGPGVAPFKGTRSSHSVAAPASEAGNRKPRGQRWKEPPGEEPVRKKRGRPMTKNLDLDPDPDPGEGEAHDGRGLQAQCSKRKVTPGQGGRPGLWTLASVAIGSTALQTLFYPVLPSRPPIT